MLGYWKAGPPAGALEAVQEAERLGFDSVWTAEAYGSDAFTPLAWWGAATSTIRLATGIAQLSARTPASTAMTAMTLDHLSGGRVILGLGVSGPQVVEGWYGQPFPKPLARTREYVAILRSIMARQAPVTAPGPQLPLPRTGEGTTGLGKPLMSTLHPLREHIPIHLAAEGPKNTALAAEIADGWLPFLFSPASDADARALLAEGFARRDPTLPPADAFEVSVPVPIVVDDSVEAAADRLRPMIALYVGGWARRGRTSTSMPSRGSGSRPSAPRSRSTTSRAGRPRRSRRCRCGSSTRSRSSAPSGASATASRAGRSRS